MKNAFLIMLFLGLSSVAHAGSAEDCTLDLKELASPIEGSAGSIKTLQAPKLDAKTRSLTHVIQLSSGAKVAFSEGGCVHYAFSYTFSQLKQMPTDKGTKLFDFIRTQVQLIPLKKDKSEQADFLKRMIDTLEQAATNPANWTDNSGLSSSFGDANIDLGIKSDGFVLSYDFAL